jgi:hypothetical protein
MGISDILFLLQSIIQSTGRYVHACANNERLGAGGMDGSSLAGYVGSGAMRQRGKASGLGAQKRHCEISESPDDRDPGRFENECDF